jgi:hypothetical protein
MGFRGLFQFLKRFAYKTDTSKCIVNKSVGIDIFWFIHKSKGDIFALQTWLLPIIKASAKTWCVFDGVAPPEKREELYQKMLVREELQYTIKEIEKFLRYPFNCLSTDDRRHIHNYLRELKQQAWFPSNQFIEEVIKWLRTKGCEIYQATGEADDALIELEKNNVIDVIYSNDSDMLLLGSHIVLKPLTPTTCYVYDIGLISANIGFTANQWGDFMHLCNIMKEKDVIVAYSLISVYKELDYAIEKYTCLYKDESINV